MPDSICVCIVDPNRQTAELLVGAGASSIVAASHRSEKIVQLTERRREFRDANLDDSQSLVMALRNVDRLLIVHGNPLGMKEKLTRRLQAVVDAARQAGVQHLIYPSLADWHSPDSSPGADYLAAQQPIRHSGISNTILRVGCTADYLLHRLPGALRSGRWLSSAGDGRVSFIPREETAHAVSATLHAELLHDGPVALAGPQAFSVAELVHTVNAIFGSTIELQQVSDATLYSRLIESGLARALAGQLVAVDRSIREGRLSATGSQVEDLTTRAMPTLADFLAVRRLDILLAIKHGWDVLVTPYNPPALLQFP